MEKKTLSCMSVYRICLLGEQRNRILTSPLIWFNGTLFCICIVFVRTPGCPYIMEISVNIGVKSDQSTCIGAIIKCRRSSCYHKKGFTIAYEYDPLSEYYCCHRFHICNVMNMYLRFHFFFCFLCLFALVSVKLLFVFCVLLLLLFFRPDNAKE